MRRIASSNGLFVDGNASNGTPGTIVTAAWLNAVQEEIISVMTTAGVVLDAGKTDQLATAIATLLRGRATVNVAGGVSVSLTPAQYGLPILLLTGALTANINVIFPASTGAWIVRNQTSGAFTVTCKTATGSGVVLSQGTSNALWGDGANIYAEQSDWANMALTGTPTAPTAADGTNTTQLANTAFVQAAVGGYLAKAVTGGTVTLTDAEASNPVIAFTGTLTTSLVVVVPATTKRLWAIYNATAGAFSLTVKTAAGSGVTVAQGKRNLCYTDGTNVYDGFNDFESIALTGAPTAPTPVPAVSQQVANMEAVLRSMGSYRGYRNLTASTVLTVADVGFYLGISATGLSVTLPAVAGLLPGSTFTFGANGAFTIVAAAGSTLSAPGGAGLASVVMAGFCSVVWRGDFWQVVSGGDTSVLAPNGWKRFADGSILQWGIAQNSAADLSISFTVPFPNDCLVVYGCSGYTPGSGTIGYVACGGWSKTGFVARTSNPGLGWHWFAIGR